MLLNKKDFFDFQNVRIGEFLFFNQALFESEQAYPNHMIYDSLCSLKGFLVINSFTILFFTFMKKYKTQGRIKIAFCSYLNYNLFYRSYKKEFEQIHKR